MGVDASRYAAIVGEEHRRRFGQYFTPPAVARFMVDWALGGGAKSIHDPGFGLGAFLDAADGRGARFSASEVDRRAVRFFQESSHRWNGELREEDYLLVWGRRFDAIVCNPPYLRFQRFRDRHAILAGFRKNLGFRLSGYTNSASAFLVKSLSELTPGGRLAYVTPLEFLNTGYGMGVKERLLASGASLSLIQLDCEKDVFPDVITSVGIVLLDTGAAADAVRFHSVRSLEELEETLGGPPIASVPTADLRPEERWIPHFTARSIRPDRTRVGSILQYGRFTRGIATGANDFFVMRPSRARALSLEAEETARCITKSRQVRSAVFTKRDLAALADKDDPVLFFRAGPRPSPPAATYIAHGEERGLHRRYLLRQRRPWFKSETRNPAPLLLGVFSRGDYKVVLNRSGALNLTCFHGFVPRLLGRNYVDRLFLYLISETGRDLMADLARRYGDSLVKYEPHDLNDAPVPVPEVLDQLGADEVADAVVRVRAGAGLPSAVENRFRALVA